MTPRTNSCSSDDDSTDGFCCGCNGGLAVAALTIDSSTTSPQNGRLSMIPPPPPPPTPIQPGKYKKFLEQWSSDIQSYMQSTLVPNLIDAVVSKESVATFVKACTAVRTRNHTICATSLEGCSAERASINRNVSRHCGTDDIRTT